MELNHLRHFYFVAAEGGFSKAAKALRIAQPAVSKSVRNLEDALEVRLFDRIGTKVHLTQAGADVFRHCQVIFSQVRAIDTLFDKKREVGGTLNFGSADALLEQIIPQALAKLLKAHARIKPMFVVSTATELCKNLSEKKIDFALAFHIPTLPSELEIRQHYLLPFRLVVSAKHANDIRVKQSFIGSREVDVVGETTYPTLARLRKDFPDAQISISTNSLSAHRKLVLEGQGVAVLPLFLVENDIKRGVLKTLYPRENFEFKLKVLCRKNEPLSAASALFLKSFEGVLSQ